MPILWIENANMDRSIHGLEAVPFMPLFIVFSCHSPLTSDCRNQSSFRKNQEVKNEAGRERGSKPRNATEGNSIELRLCEM